MYKDLRFLASVIDQRMGHADKKPKIPSYTYRGQDAKLPSADNGVGNAAVKETIQYTGTKMIGITVRHKSCLQPIFSKEDAIDSANMRR